MRAQMEATVRLKRPFSLHRYRPRDPASAQMSRPELKVADIRYGRLQILAPLPRHIYGRCPLAQEAFTRLGRPKIRRPRCEGAGTRSLARAPLGISG